MKAAVFHGKEDLRIEDVEEPTPGPGQVKLRNAFNGICGSDLHIYFTPEHAGLDFNHTQILGHEFSGTVVELGEGVTNVKVGDRAAVYPMIHCGHCAACRRGILPACRNLGSLGATADGGGMSNFVVADAKSIHVLPDNVDLAMGALVEPMAVAWHAVVQGNVMPGQTALIAGAGPIGIGALFALRAKGVDKVLVSEPNAERRAIIERLGARTVDPVNGDLAAAVAELTAGDGVDVAIDAAGAGPAFTGAIASLVPGGRLVVVALHERPVEFSPTMLMLGETEVVGSVGYLPEEFDEVIAAMADGFYDTTGWVQQLPLENAESAIKALRGGTGAKILLDVR